MDVVLAFLATLGCFPNAELIYVLEQELNKPGYYKDGVVTLRSKDPAVLVHELYHSCQFQKSGRAKTAVEWNEREADAHRVEIMFRQKEM